MIQSHVSGIDGTISELDWNIFSENESDILAIGENALEWDVNGSNVERSGASFGFKNVIKKRPLIVKTLEIKMCLDIFES